MTADTKPSPVVLITGVSRSLGHTIAHDFDRRGWSAALHFNDDGINGEPALASEIASPGSRIKIFAADFTNQLAVEQLIPAVTATVGAPACLIINTTAIEHDHIAGLTAERWDHHFARNLKAPVFLAQLFAASLPDSVNGTIINIINRRTRNPSPNSVSNTASKSELWSMTQTLARALAPRIRVNAVELAETPGCDQRSKIAFRIENESLGPDYGASHAGAIAAIRFILDAPAMTGQMIALDGGQ